MQKRKKPQNAALCTYLLYQLIFHLLIKNNLLSLLYIVYINITIAYLLFVLKICPENSKSTQKLNYFFKQSLLEGNKKTRDSESLSLILLSLQAYNQEQLSQANSTYRTHGI